MSSRVSLFAALAVACIAAVPAPIVHAQSKRDLAATAVLQQRMEAAEKHYRDAMLAEDEEAAATASNAALAEIRAVVEACGKQRGCAVPPMLETYERLLKATPQLGEEVFDEDQDPIDEGDFTSTNVPDSANASSLLSDDGQRFVRMVQFNPAVQAGIRRWLTDMRPSLMDSYENYRYMQHLMSPAFKRHGLPEALLFGIMAKESNGKVHAGSRAGAVGPLQFMPATGRRFGLGNDGTGFDTRYDPAASADAAAQYLSERMAQLGNSIELSLAGYNGGEGRALRVYQGSGGRSFWNYDVYNQFPAETKDYVPMVIAAAWLFLHPKEYGIRWPRVSARPATITLSQPASIYELTICLGNYGSRDGYMRALRNLNPRWDADSTIPAGSAINATTRIAWLYRFNCGANSKRAQLAEQLVASNVQSALVRIGPMTTAPDAAADTSLPAQDAPPPPKPATPAKPKTYKVQRGENLTGIARKFDCDLGDFAKANKLKAPKYAIRPGQALKLEGCKN
ncbi:transglycosylase SLT domain-containing protein [Thermomonas sp. HDW16]|uniref:transglycosylase SLT domain-containing protein n=1 Tax=Thermomonas sp. HDW16 TaxID=2714945 RepID=UPI0014097ED9|nr:transglycosylase SLT domain-containing protein [Thermomonas sp. HDW16]QIL20433.1 transglycosylase SLT domain-containing protein [Thermomonas sp. HDW16]